VGLSFALLVLPWSEQSRVLAATAAPNNLEVDRRFFFLLSFGFSFLSLAGRGGRGRERAEPDCRSGGGEQARLQDLGAPVRLIKRGFCLNSITSKIKLYDYLII
jgi:hypothetical protein